MLHDLCTATRLPVRLVQMKTDPCWSLNQTWKSESHLLVDFKNATLKKTKKRASVYSVHVHNQLNMQLMHKRGRREFSVTLNICKWLIHYGMCYKAKWLGSDRKGLLTIKCCVHQSPVNDPVNSWTLLGSLEVDTLRWLWILGQTILTMFRWVHGGKSMSWSAVKASSIVRHCRKQDYLIACRVRCVVRCFPEIFPVMLVAS